MSRSFGLVYEILLPSDETYTDISAIVDSAQSSLHLSAMNALFMSVIDSFTFVMQNRSLTSEITASDIIADINTANKNHSKVFFRVTHNGSRIFTGYLRPDVSRSVSRGIPSAIQLTAEDMSYKLDKPMSEFFEYPDNLADSGYKVCDPDDTDHSILHQRLYAAGYTDSDIASDIQTIDDTVRHTSGEQDSDRHFREYLDTLLYEYGAVLDTNSDGEFYLHILDADSFTPTATITQDFLSTPGFSYSGKDNTYDGCKLTWSSVEVIEQVRVYQESVSIKDGFPQGIEIEAGAYFPETADIEEVWQEFTDRWADIPYMTKASRLKNEDLTLLTAKNVTYDLYKDDDISMLDILGGVALPQFEPKKARYAFYNAGSEAKKLYWFDLYADVLIRNTVRTSTAPDTAEDPYEYESEFIFDSTQAEKRAISLSQLVQNMDMGYSWTSRTAIEKGAVLTLSATNSGVSTVAIVTEVVLRFLPDSNYPAFYEVSAISIDDYTTVDVETRSSTPAPDNRLPVIYNPTVNDHIIPQNTRSFIPLKGQAQYDLPTFLGVTPTAAKTALEPNTSSYDPTDRIAKISMTGDSLNASFIRGIINSGSSALVGGRHGNQGAMFPSYSNVLETDATSWTPTDVTASVADLTLHGHTVYSLLKTASAGTSHISQSFSLSGDGAVNLLMAISAGDSVIPHIVVHDATDGVEVELEVDFENESVSTVTGTLGATAYDFVTIDSHLWCFISIITPALTSAHTLSVKVYPDSESSTDTAYISLLGVNKIAVLAPWVETSFTANSDALTLSGDDTLEVEFDILNLPPSGNYPIVKAYYDVADDYIGLFLEPDGNLLVYGKAGGTVFSTDTQVLSTGEHEVSLDWSNASSLVISVDGTAYTIDMSTLTFTSDLTDLFVGASGGVYFNNTIIKVVY